MADSTLLSPAASISRAVCVLPVVVLASTGVWASNATNVCSNTAQTLLTACGADTKDNYFVANATCQNLADAEARSECLAEAKDTRKDDASDCHDVYYARQDVCDALATEDPYDPPFGPDYAGDFVNPLEIGATVATNAYFPLRQGSEWEYLTTYQNEEGDEITENDTVTVTNRTKLIEGVTCLVVTDTVRASDGTVEDTEDWYAQDVYGNVWYCGESSQDKETFAGDDPQTPELVSIDGSWKTGREGAKPGILMYANPEVGKTYREELAWTEAEDVAEVLATDADESAHQGEFKCNDACVETRAYTALEPDANELKYYAPNVGLMLEVDQTNGARNELVSYTHP